MLPTPGDVPQDAGGGAGASAESAVVRGKQPGHLRGAVGDRFDRRRVMVRAGSGGAARSRRVEPGPGQIPHPAHRLGGHQRRGQHRPLRQLGQPTASSLSVFGRPGTFFTCAALTSHTVNPAASSR